MEKWTACGVTIEGEPINVGGINPWDHPWASQRRRGTLPHPSYPHQRHDLGVYTVHSGGRRITFAARELSANVWGFYVPAAPPT